MFQIPYSETWMIWINASWVRLWQMAAYHGGESFMCKNCNVFYFRSSLKKPVIENWNQCHWKFLTILTPFYKSDKKTKFWGKQRNCHVQFVPFKHENVSVVVWVENEEVYLCAIFYYELKLKTPNFIPGFINQSFSEILKLCKRCLFVHLIVFWGQFIRNSVSYNFFVLVVNHE